MKITADFDFRNAKAILGQLYPGLIPEVVSLNAPTTTIDLAIKGAARDLSAQLAKYLITLFQIQASEVRLFETAARD